MEEKCDIVDRHDKPVEVRLRSQVGDSFVNTRYVNIFFRNDKGQIWVPKRHKEVMRWRLGPDFSVGGAVEAGEDYLTAAIREAREETGVEIPPEALQELAYVSPYKFPVSSFMKVYEYRLEESPTQIAEEYESAEWCDLKELFSVLTNNLQPTKPDLFPLLRLCYGTLSDIERTTFAP